VRRKKPRAPVTVRIDRLDPKRASGLDAEGRRFEVRNAPLDALVEAQPGRRGEARLLRIVENAADAPTPPCPVFGVCGGCQLQWTSLERQRQHKQALVERLVGLASHPIEGTAEAYGYRNKLELAFSAHAFHPEHEVPPSTGPAHLGLHPPGWYAKVVPIPGCPLASPRMNAVIAAVAGLRLGPGWDARAHTGHFRHLVIREGSGLVVTLVTTSTADPSEVARASRAIAAVEGVSGVLHVVNDGVSDVATGELRTVLSGSADIEVAIGGVALSLPYDGFFQVNTPGAALLYARIGEALGVGGTLLDLYCGNGVIGVLLARGFDRVIGVDVHEPSIARARANAERNAVRGAWYAGAVEEILPAIAIDRPLKVVVDPPRAGLHPRAVQHLAGLSADTLVYVACNPGSLGRDRPMLEAGGWRITDLWSVDLFPQTPHVEAIARFVR
jgi:23S rRNA (uracil1939-C5)-methyltransferase